MIKKLSSQFVRFAIIGTCGFLIDGAVLTFLSVGIGINIYFSRLVSFTSASLVTWLLNRQYTFSRIGKVVRGSPRSEYFRYMVIQISSAVLNLGVFSWLVAENPALQTIPVLPLAVGACVAMIFSFIGARIWVYQLSQDSNNE